MHSCIVLKKKSWGKYLKIIYFQCAVSILMMKMKMMYTVWLRISFINSQIIFKSIPKGSQIEKSFSIKAIIIPETLKRQLYDEALWLLLQSSAPKKKNIIIIIIILKNISPIFLHFVCSKYCTSVFKMVTCLRYMVMFPIGIASYC